MLRAGRPWYKTPMSGPDLNLLIALDALLTEGSVARAAKRLQLSPSAMSRTLARLRETTGDPLLVRAGRGLVPTPRALALRERIGPLVREAKALLRPVETLELDRLVRTFTLRARDGFVENFGPDLLDRVSKEAPNVRLRFLPKPDKDSAPLRDGRLDLDIGVVGSTTGPEVRTRPLFRDRFIGVVRDGHPLSQGECSPVRYAAARHVQIARNEQKTGPIDDALHALDLERQIITTVSEFPAALTLVRASDLVASVPERLTANLCDGLYRFPLPLPKMEMTISMLWHPRFDADLAHRWLRECVRQVCANTEE